ncbi:MAG: hypothetical protein WBQ25_19145 [Nitrososphaeraceae archaeon]
MLETCGDNNNGPSACWSANNFTPEEDKISQTVQEDSSFSILTNKEKIRKLINKEYTKAEYKHYVYLCIVVYNNHTVIWVADKLDD